MRTLVLAGLALFAASSIACPTSAVAADAAAGLTEALVVGTGRVVDRLGKPGGFLDDPKVRIRCPAPSRNCALRCRWLGSAE